MSSDVLWSIDDVANEVYELRELAEELKYNTKVIELKLNNKMCFKEHGVVQSFAKMLEINTTIQDFDINNNEIPSQGGIHLAKGLMKNTTLTSLDLTCNCLETCWEEFAEMLKVNQTLQNLAISVNEIGSGIIPLVEALKVNTTLETLLMFYTDINDTDGVVLGDLLKTNTTLKTLDFASNYSLENKSIQSICDGLMVNTTVTDLDLSSIGMTDEHALMISKALKHNRTLQKLTLDKNGLTKEGIQSILDAVVMISRNCDLI